MEKYYLGVDIGGTKIKAGIVTKNFQIIKDYSIDFKKGSPKKNLERLFETISKDFKINTLNSVGIGVAGDIDSKNGVVRFSPNLNWQNINLKQIISKITNFKKIFIDNDANCAAWGCFLLDFNQKIKNLIAITLGTGIGGGIIINGKVYRGRNGSAGEIGHIKINNKKRCSCGSYGCVEAYIGTKGLLQLTKQKLKKSKSMILKLSKKIVPETIAKACQKKDKIATEILQIYGYYLGILVGNLINIFNPDAIVFTGGIAGAYNFFSKTMINTAKQNSFNLPFKNVILKVSEYRNTVGLIGASHIENSF